MWLVFLVCALFYALTEPAEKTPVTNLVGEEHRGLAHGWYHLAVGIATLSAILAASRRKTITLGAAGVARPAGAGAARPA
jgi:hypothetical protein